MKNLLSFLWYGPVKLSRDRKKVFKNDRAKLNPTEHPEEYALLSALIHDEEELMKSITKTITEQQARERRQKYSVSLKGIFQLLGLFVITFAFIGIKRYFFG